MQRLKGKTILIGKEPGQGRLFVSVNVNGQARTSAIGQPGSVPNSVSRCKPAERTAHCKVDIDQNGTMVLTNLKPQNVTYVNGTEIASKKVQASSEVALGKDHFPIPFSAVIETAKKLVPTIAPPPPPEQKYNIKHLEKVWIDFHDKNIEIQKRARQQALLARIPMFFTMGGGAISAIAVALNWGDEVKAVCITLTVIGIIVMMYSFYKSKNDTSIEDKEKLVEDFQDHYICPKCGKYLPVTPYKLMKKQYSMKCPHAGCGAEFTE